MAGQQNHRAPKPRDLTENETITTFEAWEHTIRYNITLDREFAQFLDTEWLKKSRANPHHGFVDQPAVAANGDIPAVPAVLGAARSAKLELMLGFIANYAQIFNRNTIVRDSTSLKSVFQMLRKHYGFQSSGAQFLNIADVRLRAEERPETLYQRLLAFIEDNLQKEGSGLVHMGELPAEDEEMTPMIENLLTYIWLERVHPGLPKLVQLRFSTELRSRTLASLKDEISQGLSSMLEELGTAQMQQVTVNAVRPPPRSRDYNSRNRQPRRAHCELCAAIKQESDHFLSRCPRVSEENKKLLKAGLKVKLTDVEQQEGESEGEDDSGDEMYCSTIRPVTPKQPSPRAIIVGRVATTEASPYLDVFCGSRAAKITLDTGCVGGNCIKAETAHRLNLPISKTKRKAFQADGATPLNVVGEVKTVDKGRPSSTIPGFGGERLRSRHSGWHPVPT